MKLLILNGPNLNFLGIRDPEIYGKQTYQDLLDMLKQKAEKEGFELVAKQSNHEGDLIDWIQEAYYDGTDGIVINPGAFTHYSYALFDALSSVTTIPKIEIHISDITKREGFRNVSLTKDACDRQIYGHGFGGYLMAIDAALELAKKNS